MFDSVVVSGGENPAGWADTFLVDLRRGFAELGLEAVHLRHKDGSHALFSSVGRELYAKGRSFFLFDLNARTEVRLRAGTGPLPRFSLMVDHPSSHAHAAGFDGRNLLGVIDRAHVGGFAFGPARRVFVPHGGPLDAAEPDPAERPYDVVFSGNIEADTSRPMAEFIGGSPEVTAIAGAAVARCLDGGEEPSRALDAALAERGFGPATSGVDGYATLLGFVTGYSQSVLRERVLNGLAGLKVCLVGSFCERLTRRFPGSFAIVKPADFSDARRLFAQSKVCLNISHKFIDGSHERVWYGMAHRCAVLTNSTAYLRRYFVDGESALFYQGADPNAGRLRELLGAGKAAAIAEAALPVYLANHTWKHRAKTIVAAMNAAWPDPRAALGSIFS